MNIREPVGSENFLFFYTHWWSLQEVSRPKQRARPVFLFFLFILDLLSWNVLQNKKESWSVDLHLFNTLTQRHSVRADLTDLLASPAEDVWSPGEIHLAVHLHEDFFKKVNLMPLQVAPKIFFLFFRENSVLYHNGFSVIFTLSKFSTATQPCSKVLTKPALLGFLLKNVERFWISGSRRQLLFDMFFVQYLKNSICFFLWSHEPCMLTFTIDTLTVSALHTVTLTFPIF